MRIFLLLATLEVDSANKAFWGERVVRSLWLLMMRVKPARGWVERKIRVHFGYTLPCVLRLLEIQLFELCIFIFLGSQIQDSLTYKALILVIGELIVSVVLPSTGAFIRSAVVSKVNTYLMLVWRLSWSLTLPRVENLMPQCVQANGFSPVWLLEWI